MQAQSTETPTSDQELLATAAAGSAARIEASTRPAPAAAPWTRPEPPRLFKAAAALQKPEDTPAVPAQDMSKAPLRVAVSGGESRQQENRAQTFAALEAVRHAAGDRPIQVLHATDAAWKTPTAMWADAYRYGRTQYSAAWKQDGEHNRLAGMDRSKAEPHRTPHDGRCDKLCANTRLSLRSAESFAFACYTNKAGGVEPDGKAGCQRQTGVTPG